MSRLGARCGGRGYRPTDIGSCVAYANARNRGCQYTTEIVSSSCSAHLVRPLLPGSDLAFWRATHAPPPARALTLLEIYPSNCALVSPATRQTVRARRLTNPTASPFPLSFLSPSLCSAHSFPSDPVHSLFSFCTLPTRRPCRPDVSFRRAPPSPVRDRVSHRERASPPHPPAFLPFPTWSLHAFSRTTSRQDPSLLPLAARGNPVVARQLLAPACGPADASPADARKQRPAQLDAECAAVAGIPPVACGDAARIRTR